MPQQRKKIVAVMDDLFFIVKVNEAAKSAGLDVEFVKSGVDALDRARQKPALMILDLNCGAVEPLQVIAQLKADQELRGISLIGYLSHVQAELKQKAQESGCDMVMARSAFSQNLPVILKRHAGAA